MKTEEKALARILFQKEVLSSNGQAYEDLFVSVMQKAFPDFKPIKPQGNLGDRKNDGYIPSQGQYFQVFAPEDITKSKSDAVTKLKGDFSGLMDYWSNVCPVKKFSFVMNDKYQGSFPTIEADLSEIKEDNNLDNCNAFLAKDLEDVLFKLQDDEIISVVGFVPNPAKISNLEFSVVNEIIIHISQRKSAVTRDSILSAPDFSEKITFNGLSQHIANLLNTASYQVGSVDEYFSMNSEFAKQEIRDNLAGMYESNLNIFGNEEDGASVNIPDIIFFNILETISDSGNATAQDAALVLMAFFFEACDIFEKPVGE